ncbi:NAD(P)-dependent oxidoreductase [Phaeobacter sp. B1627]|uniref:NAD(P)-dependent oxidoreductase n=1 Tax=Phaeobacter sp. B1627 TaxID=2583809 RepID=UPI00111B2F41|nr:NAD(P)-dependent oxidoreductase [Phaeobacter sp. B1627]TNJ42056.1 glyoxylate/hydroxypyruvate reductase A [Phaeobacter sp. B1627]
MALLIEIGHGGWYSEEELAAELQKLDPAADIRTAKDPGDLTDVTMMAVSTLKSDLPSRLPNLQLVQKLGAGVETIVGHAALAPHVRVARLKPQEPAREIAQYCLAYVLRGTRNMKYHDAAQARAIWDPVAPRRPEDIAVGILGLGHIGGLTAKLMRDMGFDTFGWSRSQKALDGVTCLTGEHGLTGLLSSCDYVCAILPSTADTRDLLNGERLAAMKEGATLINAGRGDLIDEDALVSALYQRRPGHAVLDVLRKEPLPQTNPLWKHPCVTITPHVSGWHLGDALGDVVENLRRLSEGTALLHEVDRARGY